MNVDQIATKLSEYIEELDESPCKMHKGIMKVNTAKELIQGIRKSLSELIPTNSDAYAIYEAYRLEKTLWFTTTVGTAMPTIRVL
jgi:hypothetical protein